jgi:GLPGLI family protein
MKHIILAITLMVFQLHAFSQKVFTEGVIRYDITVKGSDDPKLARAFDGANMIVWFKASHVRVDNNSSILKQTTFYDAKDGSVVLLKESGAEKYMMNLTRSQWSSYNQKYEGISYQFLNETKTVAGFVCKKAIGKLKDGSQMEVYYCPDLMPYSAGYEYAFIEIPGLVLEYEVSFGKMTAIYTATSIQTSPVSISKFDLPKAGFKILEFKQ